jgi:ribosomal protein S18 acetylase RimI-like enzyme
MHPSLEIRSNFRVDDAAVSRLHALAFGVSAEPEPGPWRERLERHSVTWTGAFVKDELVGFVHVVWDGGRHGFLLNTVVHPSHQRSGIGRAVVAAAAAEASAAGCEWLHVDFEPHLETFYRDACGFRGTSAGLRRLT